MTTETQEATWTIKGYGLYGPCEQKSLEVALGIERRPLRDGFGAELNNHQTISTGSRHGPILMFAILASCNLLIEVIAVIGNGAIEIQLLGHVVGLNFGMTSTRPLCSGVK